jgi:hypothetical protein
MSPFAATSPAAYRTLMRRWSPCLAGPFLTFAGIGASQWYSTWAGQM